MSATEHLIGAELIPLDQLRVDRHYQRDLDEARVKKMGRWRDELAGTIVVNEREPGWLVVVDGQHRYELAKLHRRDSILAVVYHLPRESEAMLFVDLQTERRNVTPAQRHKAMVAAGDREAKTIQRTLDTWAPASFAAYTQAYMILRRGGPEHLDEVLGIAASAWGREKDGFKGTMLHGISLFLLAYDEEQAPRLQLIERLTGEPPRRLLASASEQNQGRSDSKIACAIVIVQVFNRGSKGRRVNVQGLHDSLNQRKGTGGWVNQRTGAANIPHEERVQSLRRKPTGRFS